jgi:hypothetical protein
MANGETKAEFDKLLKDTEGKTPEQIDNPQAVATEDPKKEEKPAETQPTSETKPSEESETKPSESSAGKQEKPAEDPDKKSAGLIKELQEDRKLIRELKDTVVDQGETIKEQAEQIAFLQADQSRSEIKTEPEDKPDPNDTVTHSQLNKVLASKEEKERQAKEIEGRKKYVEELDDRWDRASKDAVEKYSEKNVGKFFAFENILKLSQKLCKDKPALIQRIVTDKNPAEAAYAVGLTHPDCKEHFKATTKTEVTKEIKDKITQPKPSVTKTQGTPEGVKLSELPAKKLYTDDKVTSEALMKEAEQEEG